MTIAVKGLQIGIHPTTASRITDKSSSANAVQFTDGIGPKK
jgi:hypothetical protein